MQDANNHHTPEKNKKEALIEILKILDDVKIKDNLVMIDHINKETVDLIDRDVYIGVCPTWTFIDKHPCWT